MASFGVPCPPATSRRADVLALILLTLIMGVLVYFHQAWIGQNLAPPREDDNMQLVKSLQFHQKVGSAGPQVLQQVMLGRAVDFYPPLAYGVTYGFYAGMGASEAVGRFSLMPFMLCLGFSMYGIGRRLWGPLPGLMAAITAVSAPVFSHYSHSYFLDGPLTAMVAFNLYCLVRADDFQDEHGTLLWGASVGLGLMLKWTFVPWVLVPNLLALGFALRRDWRRVVAPLAGTVVLVGGFVWWHVARNGPPPGSAEEASVVAVYLGVFLAVSVALLVGERLSRGRTAAPLAWGLLVACTLALPWYIENLSALQDGTRMMGNLLSRDPLPEKIAKNIDVVVHMLPGAPFLMLLGIAGGLSSSRLRGSTAWVLAGGLSSFALLSVLLVYSDRYIMPVLPFVCLLASLWTALLKRWAWVPLTCLVPLCAWQIVGAFPSVSTPVLSRVSPGIVALLPQTQVAPVMDDYQVLDVLHEAQATGPDGHAAIWVMNNRDRNLVQGRTYEYKALEKRLPVEILHVELEDVPQHWAVENLPRGTHLLVLWHRDTPSGEWVKAACTAAGWTVELLRTRDLPMGYRASLYRRTQGPSGGASPSGSGKSEPTPSRSAQ